MIWSSEFTVISSLYTQPDSRGTGDFLLKKNAGDHFPKSVEDFVGVVERLLQEGHLREENPAVGKAFSGRQFVLTEQGSRHWERAAH